MVPLCRNSRQGPARVVYLCSTRSAIEAGRPKALTGPGGLAWKVGGQVGPSPMDLSMGLPECLRMLNWLPYLPQSHTQFSSLLLVTEASPIHWGGCTQRWEHLDTEVTGYWLPQTLLLLIPQSKLVIWRFFRNNYNIRMLLLL